MDSELEQDTPKETTAADDAPSGIDALEGAAAEVREALRSVIDPELGINIVELGLVYGVDVDDGAALVTMTLTSPGCPAGGQLMGGAKAAAESVEGVDEAVVTLVWKPFWTPERIDPKIRAMMGF